MLATVQILLLEAQDLFKEISNADLARVASRHIGRLEIAPYRDFVPLVVYQEHPPIPVKCAALMDSDLIIAGMRGVEILWVERIVSRKKVFDYRRAAVRVGHPYAHVIFWNAIFINRANGACVGTRDARRLGHAIRSGTGGWPGCRRNGGCWRTRWPRRNGKGLRRQRRICRRAGFCWNRSVSGFLDGAYGHLRRIRGRRFSQ